MRWKLEPKDTHSSFTCHPDLPSSSQVEVWETGRVQGIDLRAMGIGLHSTTLLEVDEEKRGEGEGDYEGFTQGVINYR